MKKALSITLIFTLIATTIFSMPAVSLAADTGSQQGQTDAEYVDDQVLVVFEDTPTTKEVRSAAEEVAAEEVEEIQTPAEETPYVMTLDEGQSVEEAVEDLEKEKTVAYAQPNYLYTLEDEPAAVTTAESATLKAASGAKDTDLWNLKKIDTQKAWDLIDEIEKDGKEREKVTVAVLDSGVEMTHSDLQKMLNKDKCVDITRTDENHPSGYAPLTYDEHGHGTRVSGVIAAESGNGGVAGIAAGNQNDLIELVVVDVYDKPRSEAKATSADIVKGIDYACEQAGAKVVSMSLGHNGGSDQNDALLQDALRRQTEAGTTFVASGGNSESTKAWYPSDLGSVIGVISTDNYSNAFGVCKSDFSNYGSAKDISAPGNQIKTTTKGNKYTDGTSHGTSYAAPTVAAVAALLYYVNSSLRPDDIENILEETATDLYTKGWDSYTAAGNVNAYAAVAAAADIPVDLSPGTLAAPSVSAKSAGYNSVKISWKSVSHANGYDVFRSTSKTGIYHKVKTVSGGSTTSCTDSGLSSGKTYYYKVAAFGTLSNKKAAGLSSGIVSAKPVPAIPSGFKLYHTTYTGIKLKWSKTSGASGYEIYRSTSKNGTYSRIKRITKGSTTSYTNSKLKANKNYYYKIRAYRTSGSSRIYGSYSSVKVLKTTPAKTYISLKKNKRTRKATISWKKVSTVSGYVVYRATSKNGKYKKVATKGSGSRSYTTKKLKKGKRFYYKARAYKKYRGKRIYGPYSSVKSCKF